MSTHAKYRKNEAFVYLKYVHRTDKTKRQNGDLNMFGAIKIIETVFN